MDNAKRHRSGGDNVMLRKPLDPALLCNRTSHNPGSSGHLKSLDSDKDPLFFVNFEKTSLDVVAWCSPCFHMLHAIYIVVLPYVYALYAKRV